MERELIELLVQTLREIEIGYTPNSGYEMCNSCREVRRDGHEAEFRHLPDCKWQIAITAAEKYLND